ncbi:MAG: hypothetical protein RIB59_06475 [Rhodospirillales bacterium]
MAIIIGITAIVIGIAGTIVAWIALTKVQALSVEFVKAHIQGLRTETAKNTATLNALINKVAALERSQAKSDAPKGEDTANRLPPQSSAH